MRNALILIFSIVILICGCTKSDDSPSTPPVFQNATITILGPADSSYFPKSASVTISAKVTADGDDHSYLRAYVRDEAHLSGPIVAQTNVTKAGDILATLPSNLSAGMHRFQVIVVNPNDSQQVAGSVLFSLYIGTPPPVMITSLEKDDVSNTVHWSRTGIANFKSYEIYAIRTDEIPDRGPVPEGTLIGTVTNQDSLSFRHTDIMFYYKYSYMVKLVTDEDHGTNSERGVIASGSYLQLDDYRASNPFYDPQTQRIYMLGQGKLNVLDPMQLAFVDSIPTPEGIAWMGMNDTRTRLNFIVSKDFNVSQAGYLDIASRQTTLSNEFTYHAGPDGSNVLIDNFIVHAGFIPGPPFKPLTYAYNIETGVRTVLRFGNTRHIALIGGNRIVISDEMDSAFVFSYNSGNFTLEKSVTVTGAQVHGRMVHEGSNLLAIGTSIFDQSFNRVHEIDFGGTGDTSNFFIGISNDGQYAVTRRNEVINIATKQVERRYGDVFGGLVFFSTDNDVMFHFTENGFNVRWQPGSRMHRYPWR